MPDEQSWKYTPSDEGLTSSMLTKEPPVPSLKLEVVTESGKLAEITWEMVVEVFEVVLYVRRASPGVLSYTGIEGVL